MFFFSHKEKYYKWIKKVPGVPNPFTKDIMLDPYTLSHHGYKIF